MERVKELTSFYSAIKDDHRISSTHISLYMTLFQVYNLNCFQNPVSISRAGEMKIAKISGLATYHKCIKDLNDFGYIQYLPSYNPVMKSQVYLASI